MDHIQWEKVIIPSGSYIQWKRWSFHHSTWIIYNGKRWSFHVDHIQWEKVVIQSFIYTMEKGGHSIIPCGYNGKRWSFQVEHIQWEKVGHSKWNIYNGKMWVIPSATTIGKDNHLTWIIYNGEKVVMPSFLVDHIQWIKVVIPSGTYTMRKGGDSIIPRGSYNRKS